MAAREKKTAQAAESARDDRVLALDRALADLDKQFGRGTVMKLGGKTSMQVDSAARDEMNQIGRENFIQKYGQFGFGINLQTRKYEVYTSREVLAQSESFVVDPETPESKAAWESGIGEVSFRSGENRTEIFTLRYEDNGKVSFFKNDKLGGVFSRLKE